MANISEKRLVDVLMEHMRKTRTVAREFPHYEKRIDVITYCSNDQSLESIEAKTRNWPRAIQQAILNLTAVDYSYVAIWSEAVHLVDHSILEEYGIGLISVGTKWGEVEVKVVARRSELTNRFVKKHIGDKLSKEQVR